MYEAIVNLKPVGSFKSFNEAFIKFFEEIVKVIEGGTSYQWLETANFLVSTQPGEPTGVMTFYDARDCAHDIGLMVDGKIQQGVAEPAPGVISQAFKDCADKRELHEINELNAMVEEMLKLASELVSEL